MPRGELPSRLARSGFDALPAESDYVSPFAVQYPLPAPVANPASSPLAVRGIPEMNSAEMSPLVVQGPVTTQPDLSQFQNFNPLAGANFSNAFGGSGSASVPQGLPSSYAIPENYGNPKNKIYQLSAAPGEGVRLKAVDGTVLFEGTGPEAAAKASSIVQELGKQFGTQSTWVLDKQPVGGDWKQVSQDTVGEKKTTAVNAFLNVAAPIAGALLAFVPGIGPALMSAASGLGATGSAAALTGAQVMGAGLGSVANSALQNKNSAQAIKDAAVSMAGTYLGAKIAPSVTSAFKGLTNTLSPIAANTLAPVVSQGAGALTQAGTQAATSVIPEIVITAAKQGLTSAIAPSIGAGLSGLVRPDFNPTLDTTVPKPDLAAKTEAPPVDATQPVQDFEIMGSRTVPATPLNVIGAGLPVPKPDTSQFAVKPFEPTPEPKPTDGIEEIVVPGVRPVPAPPVDPLAVIGAGVNAPFPKLDTTQFEVKPFEPAPEPKPTDNIDEIVVTAKPKIDPLTVIGAGVPTPTFDASQYAVKPFDTTPKPPAPTDNIDEIVVTAPEKLTPVGSLGAGLTLTGPTTPTIDEIVVPGTRPVKTDQVIPAAAGAGVGALTSATPNPTIEEIVIQAEKLPEKVQYKPAAEAAAGIVAANTLANTLDTTPKTPMEKAQDWIKKNPLQAASLGLTALSGLAAGTKSGTGSGSTGNMPGNIGAAGTRASLSPTFTTGTLPPASSTLAGGALSGVRTPAAMDMSTDDWLRYGLRPEKTFFANSAPVAQEIPIKKARGGAIGGAPHKSRSEFAVHGAGTGRSDDIPAVLSDGEYVLDAETVALLGDGSNKAGAEKLDQFRVNLRRHKGANLAKGRISVNAKSPEKYLAGGRV